MSDIEDRWNCLKNLIRMMCIDGSMAEREKKFLLHAARKMDLAVENWTDLIREVKNDPVGVYPIRSEVRALAVLKSLLVMAKIDQQVDEREKEYLQRFAKSIGVTGSRWRSILKEIDLSKLFDPFRSKGGTLLVLKEDFESLDALLTMARQCGIAADVTTWSEWRKNPNRGADAVCFHAVEKREVSVEKCQALLKGPQQKVVCVLMRYQGYQVRYLLESGIHQCIIEPVYHRDLERIFSGS